MSESWKDNGDDDVQMPLGTGGEGAGESFEEPKPKMNTSTLALVASFAAALVVLYLLGLHNKPRSASAEQLARDTQIQSAITELLQKKGATSDIQNLFKDTDKLVQMFYHYLGSNEAQAVELPRNPFAQDSYVPSTPATEAVRYVNNNAADAENLRQVAATFNTLKLQSVMVGKTSVAMINNRLLHVGNKVGELTITAIEPNRVLLSYGKNTFELKPSGPSIDK